MQWLALLWPLLLGHFFAGALGLRWRMDRIAYPAWAWLLGCLLLAALLQLSLLLRLPVAFWGLVPVPPLLVLAVRAADRRRPASAASLVTPPVGRAYACFVGCACLFGLLLILAGADRPCIEGDEGNIWALKARSLLVDWPADFAAAQVHNLHPDYPQLNPLLQAFVYALSGEVGQEAFANRWLVQGCNLASLLALAGALRRLLPAALAALLTVLWLLEPEFQQLLRTAYADGMVALGLLVAVDAWLRSRDGVAGDAAACRRLGGAALAFAVWSKNEPMLYLLSLLGAYLVLRLLRQAPKASGMAVWYAPALLVLLFTALWNRAHGLHSDLLGANPTGKSLFVLLAEQWRERSPVLLLEPWRLAATMRHAHLVLPLLLLFGATRWSALRRAGLAVPLLALFGSWLGLHVVYVGSFLPLRFHLDTSYARVTAQLLPVALLLLAVVAKLARMIREDPAASTTPTAAGGVTQHALSSAWHRHASGRTCCAPCQPPRSWALARAFANHSG